MKLTSEEKNMLNGDYGEGVATAMEVQVGIGEAFGAKRMEEITRAHVALSNQEADLWFVEKLVEGGAKCKISPTVNPAYDLEYFEEVTELSNEDKSIINRTREAYKNIGATLTYNCTPYLEKNIPRFGEITAYSESSATPYINSVYGARTNRESAQSALCAAVTGRVPVYGLLLDKNRQGEVLVDVEADIDNEFDYQLLGYSVPEKIKRGGVPVFVGLSEAPSPEALMNLGAQLNTAGAVPLYHIVGVTPEAPTLNQAFQGEEPREKVKITKQDLDRKLEEISLEKSKIYFALFGCPHFTIDQVGRVVKLLKGRTFAVDFWICTSSLTKELAKKMGYLDILEKAGGHIVADTCIDQPCWNFLYGKKGITDSPKCSYYTQRRDMDFVIRDLPTCVESAIEGEVI